MCELQQHRITDAQDIDTGHTQHKIRAEGTVQDPATHPVGIAPGKPATVVGPSPELRSSISPPPAACWSAALSAPVEIALQPPLAPAPPEKILEPKWAIESIAFQGDSGAHKAEVGTDHVSTCQLHKVYLSSV